MTNEDEVLAAYVAGIIQAALDTSRAHRSYLADGDMVLPHENGTWSAIVRSSRGAWCTITLTPGQPPSQPARPSPGG